MTAKLAYLMRYDSEFDPDAMREIIYDLFAGSFENDCGSTDEIIDVLSTAIFKYRIATEDGLDVERAFIKNGREAEKYFCDCVKKILIANEFNATSELLDDYAVWPDVLSVETTWEKEVLRELALIQAGHDLVVREQLKQLWAEETAKREAAQKAE
jgi:hypothetical protein